ADRDRRDRVGCPAAVADHAAAPARAGLLVARRRAADPRRAGRRALLVEGRAGAARGPRAGGGGVALAAGARTGPLAVRDRVPDPRALPARRGDRRPPGLAAPRVARLPVAVGAVRDGRADVA